MAGTTQVTLSPIFQDESLVLSMTYNSTPEEVKWVGSARFIDLSVKEALDKLGIAESVGQDMQAVLDIFEKVVIQSASIEYDDYRNTSKQLALSLAIQLDGIDVGIALKRESDANKNGAPDNTSWGVALQVAGFDFEPQKIENGFWASLDTSKLGTEPLRLGTLLSFLPPELSDIEIPIPKRIALVYQKPGPLPTGQDANPSPSASAPNGKDPSRFLVGVEMDLSANLSDHLPLIGGKFPADQQIGLEDLHLVYLSNPFPQQTIDDLRRQAELSALLAVQGGQLHPGINFSGSMRFGDLEQPLFLPMPEQPAQSLPDPAQPQPDTAPPPAPNLPSAPAKPKDALKWFNVNKKLGPVHLNRVGVQYRNGLFWLGFDAALSLAGLTLSLDGLALGFEVSAILKRDFAKLWPPHVQLRGVGLDYRQGAVLEIAGALLRSQIIVDGQTVDQYAGGVLIKTEELTITAIGAYAELNGHPSLFVYSFLGTPLGGPAFFFVTGLAAGFGYNRRLLSPQIDQIAQFPLVQIAMGDGDPLATGGAQSVGQQLLGIVQQLQVYIPPALGEVFLAIGIRFSTFKLINSFALLVLSFGQEFQIRLLGLTKLIAPLAEAADEITPIAEVQIGLLGVFRPAEGILSIDGSIQPGSYLLSRDCHLGGGFAFYCWFRGEHAGDFVFTVGGYHPKYVIPDHYPRVQRLGFSWQLDSDFLIKGDAYFALTSTAIMAGGHLDAVYNSGNLHAWFHCGADFLISWQPYHYDISLSLSIGVSYKFSLCLFGHCLNKTVSVSLDVGLDIWGPDFSGTAHIDWTIISFDVSFGASDAPTPLPISWDKFKQAFLPHDESKFLTLSARDGLLDKVQATDAKGNTTERWVVNPKHTAFSVDAVVPAKELHAAGQASLAESDESYAEFAVGPMLLGKGELNSSLTVTVEGPSQFVITPVGKLVPAGLWGEMGRDLKPQLDAKSIPNVLSGVEIRPANPPTPGYTRDIEAANLQFETFDFPGLYDLSAPAAARPAVADLFCTLKAQMPGDTGQYLPDSGLPLRPADFLEAPLEGSLL